MKEYIAQVRKGIPYPSSDTDMETIKSAYKENQLIRCKTYAVSKGREPSVIQNNLLHSCFKLVADNHPQFQTLAQVKFRVKVLLDYRHEDRIAVRPDGTIQFEYRSFGFKDLRNMERLNIFERAFELLADMLGITVDELIAEAKSRMLRRR